jgi:acetoin utilization deacetylase AcuC-like enzyme
MRNFFTIVLSALTATVVTLFLQKSSHPQENKPQRKSRSIAEIAPTFKTLEKKYAGDEELYEDHQKMWIKFVREAVQADLTELEADQIAEAILSYQPPPYNYFEPLFPSEEKEEAEDE